MEQLNGFDAFFIKGELKSTPQHITHIYIYDPSSSRQPLVRFKDILANFDERLNHVPAFKRRLVQVPLELDNPYWIDADDFNIEYHVRHISLPQPGDWRQFCILMSRLHSQCLDMSKPMWQAYVVEGLDGIDGMPEGAFAIMYKMHHAMVDGKAAIAMLETIHDGDAPFELPAASEWKGEAAPGGWDILKRAAVNGLKQPLHTARKTNKVIATYRKKSKFKRENPNAELVQNEKTLFNQGVKSPHRVWGAKLFSVKAVRDIKSCVAGATINDVVLCVTSYAVQQYLDKHGDGIAEPLIVNTAVDTRGISEYEDGSNHATFMPLSVHSNIEAPVERLAAICKESQMRKESLRSTGSDMMRDAFDALPGSVLNATFQVAEKLDLLSRPQMGFHYAVTNVPGPRSDRLMVGARAVCSFGMAPLLGSAGLAFVITSYCDAISISFTCCRDTVPDPEFLEQCIADAYEKVQVAALSHPASAPRSSSATVKRVRAKKSPSVKNKVTAN